MQITFAGTVIAQEPSDGGLDAVSGFVPQGKQLVQWAEYLRTEWALPIPRGNRKNTITGRIILGTQADLPTAMQLRGTYFATLPSSGVLVFSMGNFLVTFSNAVLESCATMKDSQGVSVGFELTFLAGIGTASGATSVLGANEMQDESGAPITDESNNPIQNS